MFTTTTTARARVSTFTASEEYDRKMSSSAYAQRRRNCHNRGRYFVRTSSFGYYYSRNEERRRRSLSGLMLATTSEPNADGNNSNDGRLVMIRKKNLRILRTGRLSSLRRMNSTALDGKSSSPSSSSVDDVEDDEDEEDNSNNSIGEEKTEKTTTTTTKKTANEQQSSSSETVVLLATAAIASGLIAYKGGPEQSIEYVQSFVESFFVDLIKNHSEGVGGIIEDVYLSTLFFGDRIRFMAIFGRAETDWESNSKEIENICIHCARFLGSWCSCGSIVCRSLRTRISREPWLVVDVGNFVFVFSEFVIVRTFNENL